MSGRGRILPPAPALVDGLGRFSLGLRTQPYARVNPLDAAIEGPLGRSRTLRRLALKEWQHFALVDDRYYISLAIFDAKRLALAQIIVFDRKRGRLVEYERRALPPEIQLPDTLLDDHASFRRGGFEIAVRNRIDEGRHELRFRAPASLGKRSISGRFTLDEDLAQVEPMIVTLPLGDGRAMYSHKAVLPCRGELTIGGKRHRFDSDRSYGLADVHKGYYPFVMTWHWATGGRVGSDGKLIGFNLTDNQVRDQARYNENGLWVDGRLSPLPPVRFTFDERDHLAPWKIQDREGRVDLRFRPEALRRVDINLVVMRSRYRGPFGSFEGRILDEEGRAHRVDAAYGMCEDFYLRA